MRIKMSEMFSKEELNLLNEAIKEREVTGIKNFMELNAGQKLFRKIFNPENDILSDKAVDATIKHFKGK